MKSDRWNETEGVIKMNIINLICNNHILIILIIIFTIFSHLCFVQTNWCLLFSTHLIFIMMELNPLKAYKIKNIYISGGP